MNSKIKTKSILLSFYPSIHPSVNQVQTDQEQHFYETSFPERREIRGRTTTRRVRSKAAHHGARLYARGGRRAFWLETMPPSPTPPHLIPVTTTSIPKGAKETGGRRQLASKQAGRKTRDTSETSKAQPTPRHTRVRICSTSSIGSCTSCQVSKEASCQVVQAEAEA